MTEDDNDDGFDFYGKIDVLVDDLGLPQKCFESSCRVCDEIREVDGFKYSFTSFGGYDALVAVSVFVGAKQVRVPLPAERVMNSIESCEGFDVSRGFSAKKLQQVGRKFRRETGLEPVFMRPSDYVDYYVDGFDFPVNQSSLNDLMYVSSVAVRYTYKEIVEGLTEAETFNRELEDIAITPESFGYYGESVEGFSRHLLGRIEEENLGVRGKSPQVLAASCMYIAGKLLDGAAGI